MNNYDPVAFREYQKKRLAGTPRRRVITTFADPYVRLAAAIIERAIKDLRSSRRVGGRMRPEAVIMASALGFNSLLEECEDYFSSREFENHADLVGIDFNTVRRKLRIGKK